MTAIAAIANGTTVTMGADAAGTDTSFSTTTATESKVWRAGPLLFGASGSYRVAQLIRWRMPVPVPEPSMEPLAYLVGPLADAMVEVLEGGRALTTWQEDNTAAINESSLLIGFRGHVYEMYSDFGVNEEALGYAAIGSGAPVALGALAATEHITNARRRVRMALDAAERHNASVRGPMHIEVLR